MNELPTLLDRVRAAVSSQADIVEKAMVGGRGFMLDGSMCCGVNEDGLVLRVTPETRTAALKHPNVQLMTMGSRTMEGFVRVDPAGCKTEDELQDWISRGIASATQLRKGKA